MVHEISRAANIQPEYFFAAFTIEGLGSIICLSGNYKSGATVLLFRPADALVEPFFSVRIFLAYSNISGSPEANRAQIELGHFHESPRPVGPIPDNIQISPSYELS